MEGTTNESENGTEKDSINSPDSVCNPATNKAADDGTKIVLQPLSDKVGYRQEHKERTYYADNTSLFCSLGDCSISEADANLLNISWRCVHTSHDSLVVALEEDSDEGKGLDGDVDLRRREPLP